MRVYTLYCQKYSTLPSDKMRKLNTECQYSIKENEGKISQYIYRWVDLKLTFNVMPEAKISDHLNGFVGYIRKITDYKRDYKIDEVINRILKTKLVLGIIPEPDVDREGRCEQIIGTVCFNTKSLLFYGDSIYDENSILLISRNMRKT